MRIRTKEEEKKRKKIKKEDEKGNKGRRREVKGGRNGDVYVPERGEQEKLLYKEIFV